MSNTPNENTQATPASAKENSSGNALNLNMVELTNLSAKILDQMFLKSPKDKAKPVFKDLKQGNKLKLGSVTIANTLNPALELSLDYSEFVGPGFNFDVFTLALKTMLAQISQKFQQKAELNVMYSEDNRSMLLNLPGMVMIKEQLNAMVLGFDLGDLRTITVSLMFIEPSQYEAVRKTPAE